MVKNQIPTISWQIPYCREWASYNASTDAQGRPIFHHRTEHPRTSETITSKRFRTWKKHGTRWLFSQLLSWTSSEEYSILQNLHRIMISASKRLYPHDFNNGQISPKHFSQDSKIGPMSEAKILQIQFAIGTVLLATATDQSEISYDHHINAFRFIVDTPEDIAHENRVSESAPRLFSFDLGLILCLFFTAIKCRDRDITYKAKGSCDVAPSAGKRGYVGCYRGCFSGRGGGSLGRRKHGWLERWLPSGNP